MTEARHDGLAELAQIAADLGPALVPAGHHELLMSITDVAMQIFEARAVSIALLNDSDDELVFEVAVGEGAEAVLGKRFPSSRGIAGWVVTSGQPIAISDVQRDPRFASDVAASSGYIPRSILAMPLETERRVLGVVEVLDRNEQRPAANRDMELLGLFAHQAALAIENSRVFTDLGTTLMAALAGHAEGDLRDTLQQVAAEGAAPNPELATLVAAISELGRSGPEERKVAADLVDVFLRYARKKERRR